MDLDFLESGDYNNYLKEVGLSQLFDGCADVNMELNTGTKTSDKKMQDMQNAFNAEDLIQNWINTENVQSDHDYAGYTAPETVKPLPAEDTVCNSIETMSDSGVSSASPYSRSPGSSEDRGNSPYSFSNEANSPSTSSSSDTGSENVLQLNDLQFDFTDIDMDKVINSFPVDGDDILDSYLPQGTNNTIDENVCIQLDDALMQEKTSPNIQNCTANSISSMPGILNGTKSRNTFPVTICDIPNDSSKSIYRCTLPNFKPLVLTDEEKRLLEEESVSLPTDLPLTKSEERVLKKVRRKIRNKKSAFESRKRRKDYLGGLENRVTQCTSQNNELVKKVKELENQNKTLVSQLRRLQDIVRSTSNKTTQATTCVMVLLLSFGLFLAPNYGPFSLTQDEVQSKELEVPTLSAETHKSRRVLELTDEMHQPDAKRPRIDAPVVGIKQEILDDLPFHGEDEKLQNSWKPIYETDTSHIIIPENQIKKENNSSNNASRTEDNLKVVQHPSDSVGFGERPESPDGIEFKPIKPIGDNLSGVPELSEIQLGTLNPTLKMRSPKIVHASSRLDEI